MFDTAVCCQMRMVAEVCLGKVGAVAAREASRFARNSREWQQRVEVCRVVDTVLIDQEMVYVPSRAEVTDVAMGSRAACVMLKKGPYIRETLRFLIDVLGRMEEHQYKKSSRLRKLRVSGQMFHGFEACK